MLMLGYNYNDTWKKRSDPKVERKKQHTSRPTSQPLKRTKSTYQRNQVVGQKITDELVNSDDVPLKFAPYIISKKLLKQLQSCPKGIKVTRMLTNLLIGFCIQILKPI